MARWLGWTLLTIVTWGLWAILSKLLTKEGTSSAHGQVLSTIGILPVVFGLWGMKDF